jgi:hypothetical protein
MQQSCSERKVKEKEIGEEVGGQRFDYQPNIFEAEDSEDEVNVSNQNLLLKLLLFRRRLGSLIVAILLLMEQKTSPLSSTTPIRMIIAKNLVPLSTDSFVAINYSPKIGGIG